MPSEETEPRLKLLEIAIGQIQITLSDFAKLLNVPGPVIIKPASAKGPDGASVDGSEK